MNYYVISRYNHDLSWLNNYPGKCIIYDRSEEPMAGAIVVPNVGSDIYDKFSFIIDNYNNLPAVATFCKANLFKYISRAEYEVVKDNQTFTPLLTKFHQTSMPQCFYSEDGMYNEFNEDAAIILNNMPAKYFDRYWKFAKTFNLPNLSHLRFAPGSNYILPKANILKHDRGMYMLMRECLSHAVYPAEAMIIERALYYLWL